MSNGIPFPPVYARACAIQNSDLLEYPRLGFKRRHCDPKPRKRFLGISAPEVWGRGVAVSFWAYLKK